MSKEWLPNLPVHTCAWWEHDTFCGSDLNNRENIFRMLSRHAWEMTSSWPIMRDFHDTSSLRTVTLYPRKYLCRHALSLSKKTNIQLASCQSCNAQGYLVCAGHVSTHLKLIIVSLQSIRSFLQVKKAKSRFLLNMIQIGKTRPDTMFHPQTLEKLCEKSQNSPDSSNSWFIRKKTPWTLCVAVTSQNACNVAAGHNWLRHSWRTQVTQALVIALIGCCDQHHIQTCLTCWLLQSTSWLFFGPQL